MILSRRELEEAVRDGRIKFSPSLEGGQWGQASIDLRLGYEFGFLRPVDGVAVSVAKGLDPVIQAKLREQVKLPTHNELGEASTITLPPGKFVLGTTYEYITVPRDLMGHIEGRSTYARVGLSVHQTAPLLQPGWEGHITLEIINSGTLPIILTPLKDRPCQITFTRLSSPVPEDQAYGSGKFDYYQGQTRPIDPSRS